MNGFMRRPQGSGFASSAPMDDHDDDRHCTATNRAGRRCGRFPAPGANVCSMHGAKAPGVRAKAAERLLRAKINSQLQVRGWEPVTDPVAYTLDAAGEIDAFLALAREQMGLLESWEHQNVMATEDVRARLAIYRDALNKKFDAGARLLSLGISAHAAQQAKALEQAALALASSIRRILDRLQLTPDQHELAAIVVPQVLRSLGSGDASPDGSNTVDVKPLALTVGTASVADSGRRRGDFEPRRDHRPSDEGE